MLWLHCGAKLVASSWVCFHLVQWTDQIRFACPGKRARSSLPIAEVAEPQLPPFDHTPAPYEGPPKEEVYALRKKFLSPGTRHSHPEVCLEIHAAACHLVCSVQGLKVTLAHPVSLTAARSVAALFHHFKDPIMITEGKMQYLFDERGRRYLDVRTLHHH